MNQNSSFHLFTKAMSARLICGSILSVLTICASAQAQQFNLEAYLKKKDANNNGRVDPDEMSDNTRGFLSKMGFDSSKPITISKIVNKASKDRKEMEKASTKTTRDRKVPGFGVEKDTESKGVARFGASASESGSSSSSTKYSESVMKQVSDTLKRYDRNKDGSLDKDELKGARWGSPSPEQNDTNKDGRLSTDELANRYASREQYYSSSRSGSDSNRSSAASSRDSTRNRDSEDRGRRERPSNRSSSASSSAGNSSSSSRTRFTPSSTSRTSLSRSTGSTGTTSSDNSAKFDKYADGLISQYDTDKDGQLSSEESKKMRRPPAGADANKDGVITKEEIVASLDGSNKSSSGAKSENSSDGEKRPTRTSRDRGSSDGPARSSRPGTSSSFENLDADADRLIQMHEFAEKWDDKTVEEFYEKDSNGDGVITLGEWTGKK